MIWDGIRSTVQQFFRRLELDQIHCTASQIITTIMVLRNHIITGMVIFFCNEVTINFYRIQQILETQQILYNLNHMKSNLFLSLHYYKHFTLSWLAVAGPTTHSPALADHAPEEIEGQQDGDDDEEEDQIPRKWTFTDQHHAFTDRRLLILVPVILRSTEYQIGHCNSHYQHSGKQPHNWTQTELNYHF